MLTIYVNQIPDLQSVNNLLQIDWICTNSYLSLIKTTHFHIEHCKQKYKNNINVSGYTYNHGSPSWELRTASPRGRYGERLQCDSCLKHTI